MSSETTFFQEPIRITCMLYNVVTQSRYFHEGKSDTVSNLLPVTLRCHNYRLSYANIKTKLYGLTQRFFRVRHFQEEL